jgi:hypothetical protein
MARYHLYKGTRGYNGYPYQGPSNDGVPAEAETLAEALVIRSRLMMRNPGVGWGVHDTQQGMDVNIMSCPP